MSSQATNWAQPAFLKRKIGEYLLAANKISESDLNEALEQAEQQEKRLGYILIKQGKISVQDFGNILSKQHQMKYLYLSSVDWNPELLSLLPQEFMKIKQLLPVRQEKGKLVIAVVDPQDKTLQDEVTFMTGIRPEICVTTSYEFEQFSNQLLTQGGINSLLEEISAPINHSSETGLEGNELVDNLLPFPIVDNAPVVELVNQILKQAVEQNASDIHFEPRQDRLLVRFRVDGLLKAVSEIPHTIELMVITRLKIMAKLDITEQNSPQDGCIIFNTNAKAQHLRLNSLPVKQNREKIALRLLRPFSQINNFPELGFEPSEIKQIEHLYQSPSGIVLVCGPTGSGKTTTLYTILNQLNTDDLNICTVEDPIELEIDGLNQSEINDSIDLGFCSSVRNILRQDPDVLMIGEIRDLETLKAATEAALSGQMVLSTIHSQNTSTAIQRMVELGLPPHLIATCLTGILSQRLIRKLCLNCRYPYEADEKEKSFLFPYNPESQQESLTLYKSSGCLSCNHTGYDGRTGIFEIMTVDREIQHLIQDHSNDVQIEEAAIATGMKSLSVSGREKALAGMISIDELIRILGRRF